MSDVSPATLGDALAVSCLGTMFMAAFVGVGVYSLGNICRGYYFMAVHRRAMMQRLLGDRKVAPPPFQIHTNVYRFPLVRRVYLCIVWFIGTVIMNTEYWETRHTPLPQIAAQALLVLCALLGVDVLATWLWRRSREHHRESVNLTAR